MKQIGFFFLSTNNYSLLKSEIIGKKLFLFFLVLILTGFSRPVSAQNLNEIISNLKGDLKNNPDERRKAVIYADLTWYYASVSVDSALAYGRRAVSTTGKLKDSVLLAQVYSDLGAVHFRNNDFRNAEKNYLKSYEIRKKQNNAAGIAKLNNNLASVYQSNFQYSKAMKMYLEALKFFEEKNDVKNINITKGNIGLLYVDLKDNRRAVKYISEAIAYFESQDRTTEIENKLCENYLNLGKALQMQKSYAAAEVQYKKSSEICGKVGNTQGIAFASRNLGNLYTLQRKDSLAVLNLQTSQLAREAFNSRVDTESNGIDVAQNYIVQGKYHEAKDLLLRALPVFERENSKENQLSTYKLLTNIYHHTAQPDSADHFFEKYIALDGELVNTGVSRASAELEKKYQTLQKDSEIQKQKSTLFKRNVALFALLGVLLIGIVYYRNYQHRQKAKLQRTVLEQQDLAARAVMAAEDNERKRMATHLHDGIGQLLTAAGMNVSVLNDYKEDPARFELILDKTRKILSDAISDVRTLSHQIMPHMLLKNSLSEALRKLIENTSSPTIEINLKIENLNNELDENIQMVLYRTVQECINNTLKHARATKIDILVVQDSDKIITKISDNGAGFDLQAIKRRNEGIGLQNIQTRIDFLKGQTWIKSSAGKGTEIYVEIPLKP
ncbi:sensor histidine kinase [Kaistella sp. PBT33-4]|uniref:tetratricopeptide repeat-containing sensor histidine kinase n=1 Tax=Kaistella sp. PBT33-4 TaxID=3032000 RepID=UPI0023D80501|nr:sensor histidine kinase [Kaistella sp. PBT33-4]MDF0718404.1 sensor histidine kinase [Kaistella sp. PBT33-4]